MSGNFGNGYVGYMMVGLVMLEVIDHMDYTSSVLYGCWFPAGNGLLVMCLARVTLCLRKDTIFKDFLFHTWVVDGV